MIRPSDREMGELSNVVIEYINDLEQEVDTLSKPSVAPTFLGCKIKIDKTLQEGEWYLLNEEYLKKPSVPSVEVPSVDAIINTVIEIAEKVSNQRDMVVVVDLAKLKPAIHNLLTERMV